MLRWVGARDPDLLGVSQGAPSAPSRSGRRVASELAGAAIS
eukprot:CAMPEP_0195057874 /NCGR_PEP_ID=MMETSP0448-20130528/5902_1 /TAXON_ID=66468 /ORGANISM="Heterocapsa triquestra, Strain CCMP 448" /LENGTH=40 /DNA_ID= /DNA_START= /DNA_END= /DNA_ORIENTATION=